MQRHDNANEQFQFTRARGARPNIQPTEMDRFCFNSRAHGARDEDGVPAVPLGGGVSIHARTGRATQPAMRDSTRIQVSIHARTGRATVHVQHRLAEHTVSIHARTGRATGGAARAASAMSFQFTRARGARPPAPPDAGWSRWFQFTRARGARPGTPRRFRGVGVVSIHARTGRATRGWRPFQPSCSRFNSRAPGARDRPPGTTCKTKESFNSRAHGARDRAIFQGQPSHMVSIHARTGRATCGGGRASHAAEVSIHARTGRATLVLVLVHDGVGFNSRAHGARDLGRGWTRC